MGETKKIQAQLCLIDEDSAIVFGTAGGNAITPPEKEYAIAQIEVTLDEDDILELVEKLGGQLDIDEDADAPEVSVKNGKIRICFGVIGKEPFSSTGATYDHFPFGRI